MAQIYVSLAPAIFAGILNMVWVKVPVLGCLARPIDAGRTLRDGRRVFGDNKTWKGLLGMLFLGALCGIAWGAVLSGSAAEPYNLFYGVRQNTPGWSGVTGGLLGLAYGLFELPNSFLKRRVGITPGRTRRGAWAWIFVVLDQVDSVIGCGLVLALLTPVSWSMFVAIVVLGGATHVVLNLLLYAAKLRKNPL